VGISALMLTENRDTAVDLLRSALIAPRFDDTALERVRGQVLAGIEGDAQDPDAIASASFNAMAYGDHPYATSGDGTQESVTALTRDDMTAAHGAVFSRDNVVVAAAGDITAEELGLLVDRLLGDLPAGAAPLPGPAPYLLAGGTTVVDFPTPQSSVLFGHRGLERDDPDFFAAFVLNQILGGGGFESRLMQEVREKRGLTYGVYSYLVDKAGAQLWVGQVASSNGRVAQAVEVIRDEWTKMQQSGVTQTELDDAKTYMTGAYPLRFDGNAPIANIAVEMQMEGLPPEYIVTRNDQVNAVTLEQINRVARELLDPAKLTFVVAGMPEGLGG
jgi:zinc protease